MAELTGQTFAGYEILAKLGQGGMGAVYKARQTMLNRLIALKVMSPSLSDDPSFVARFIREASAAANLNHPNMVQVYTAGEHDKIYYIAMEFVEGESLRDRLDRMGRIPPQEAVAITVYVAQALQYAWNKARLIHRDIKPDNVFLSNAGEVKVGDLGLAKSVGGETTELTQTGTAMGSPHYISPEQATGAKEVDFRTDIYSLGCTLYHMLTGQTPYHGDSSMIVMMKHVNDPPPAIFKTWPACPMPLGMLVGKMLAKDRNARPQSYEQLVDDLMAVHEKLKNLESVRAVAVTPTAPQPKSVTPATGATAAKSSAPTVVNATAAARPSGNRKMTYAAAGLAAVLALAGTAWWFAGRATPRGEEPATATAGQTTAPTTPVTTAATTRETAAPPIVSAWLPLDIAAACNADIISTAERQSSDQFTFNGGRLASASWLRKNGHPEPGLPDDGRVPIPGATTPAFFQVRTPPAKNTMLLSGPEGCQPQPVTVELTAGERRRYSELVVLHTTCHGNGTLRVVLRYETGLETTASIPVFDWSPRGRTGPLPADLRVAATSRDTYPGGVRIAEMFAQRIPADPQRTLHSLTFSFDSLTPAKGVSERDARNHFTVGVFAISALPAAAPATAVPALAGYKPLFNGKDLAGWRARGPSSHWSAEDGALVNSNKGSDLITEELFTDFLFHCEFMLPPGGNSGVFLRGRYELQVMDDAGQPVNTASSGGIWRLIAPTENASKPAGEWQTLDVGIEGKHVQVALNGRKVIDYGELTRPTQGALDQNVDQPGPIMLQGSISGVSFRNINIKPLQPLSPGGVAVSGPPSSLVLRRPPEVSPDDLRKIEDALPAKAVAQPQTPRRLAVFSRCEGFRHDSAIPAAAKAIELMGKKTGAYETEFTDDYSLFDTSNLARFDAVVFNNTSKLSFPDAARRQALLDFVRTGKGVVGIHAATDNFYEWPEGAAMMGGLFDGHPWGANGTWAFKLDDPAHFLNRAFGGKGFKLKDEVYQVKEPYTRAGRQVLLTVDLSDPVTGGVKRGVKRTDGDFAVAWTKPEGNGRVFYCGLGHAANVFQEPAVLQFYLDGIQWTLGDLKADAAPAAPASSSLDPASLRYGLYFHFDITTFTGYQDMSRVGKAPPSVFAPKALDVRQWAREAREAGATFAVFTAKHEAGFCMWPAKDSDYHVGLSPVKTDIVGEFVAACKAEGLKVGVHYAVPDARIEGQVKFRGPVEPAHFAIIKKHLAEMTANYPDILIYVLDCAHRLSPEQFREVSNLLKQSNPQRLILQTALNERRGRIPSIPGLQEHNAVSVNKNWFWSPNAPLTPVSKLYEEWQNSSRQNFPFLVNIGPNRDGRIPGEYVAVLMELKGMMGGSTQAAPSPASAPGSAQGRRLQWFGYSVCDKPSAVQEIALYTNFILLRDWEKNTNADAMIEAARKAGLKVVLRLPSKQTWAEMENTVRPFIAKHRDVIAAACWSVTYHFSDWTPETLAENSRRLKQACPQLQCWAEFVEKPKGKADTLPIPPEVDAILVNFYFDTQPESLRRKVNETFTGWMSKANGRPVLLQWIGQNVPKTTPDTMRTCAEVVREFGCAGLCFHSYDDSINPNGGRKSGIVSNPALVNEIKAIARESGFAK